MALLLIPTALRLYTDGLSEVHENGNTVGEVIHSLAAQYTDLKKHLFNDAGKLRSFVNVYLNEEDIRQKNGLDTPVTKSDTIMLIPSIAGGL